MKICPNCQLEYDEKYEFCHQCGSKLQIKEDRSFCHHCGKKIVTDGDFCPYCGKPLVYAKPMIDNPLSTEMGKNKPVSTVVQKKAVTKKNHNNVQKNDGSNSSKYLLNIVWLVFFFAIATFGSKAVQEALRKGYGIFVIVGIVILIPLWLHFKDK